MKKIEIKNKTNNHVLLKNIGYATNMDERIIGLMFKKELKDINGLLIEPCNSIHTFFMKFNLDVVFLNKQNKVVKLIRNMKPWRMTGINFSTRKILELPAGTLPADINLNSELEIINV